MAENEKLVKCKNCRQDISESKMFLHEAFCLKNNKFCGECNKVFLVGEFEEHLKTHNAKNAQPAQQKRSPPSLPEKKVIINQDKEHPISEHRKHCDHKHKDPVPKQKVPRPKIEPRVIDDNLGLKQCEYCTNMFEDLKAHYKECQVKKMIEEENAKYYKDLERRNKEDDDLAKKLAKEKIMDVSKDEQMARNLQKDLKPLIDTSKDEQMARNLQKDLKPMIDTSKDELMARDLQKKFGPMVDTSRDEMMARNLQNQFNPVINTSNDERMARDLQNQFGNPNINNYRGGNNPSIRQNEDMDDELKRVIEESKKDFFH